jgi:hypothetical protein
LLLRAYLPGIEKKVQPKTTRKHQHQAKYKYLPPLLYARTMIFKLHSQLTSGLLGFVRNTFLSIIQIKIVQTLAIICIG